MPKPICIRTNEYIEAVKALEMLEHVLSLVKKDVYHWKWAIIVLHNAVQSTMVCALKGPAGLGALEQSMANKYYEALKRGERIPRERFLDRFLGLYKRMKKELKYAPSSQVEKSIERMRELRNEFVHFTPKYSAIAVDSFPQMVCDCLEVINFLAWDPTRISWHGKGTREEAKTHFTAIIRMLEELDAACNESRVSSCNR
ncbi:MAG: hypothetical protein FJ009_10510 [Chloroflexi bacterium]|nr:hypothetical protein [Chloroflexota bacterium]